MRRSAGDTAGSADSARDGNSRFVLSPARVREVEHRTRLLLQRMKVRELLTMRQLIERYCEFTGATVLLQEKLLPVDCFFAITLKLSAPPDTYVIAYQKATPAWHQDHGIGHEFGHIIAGHYETGNVHRHSAMSPEREWEAEYTANLLARWGYEVGRVLDRQRALRPLQRTEDLSLPLQERMGWL
ncbi:hypothetical protein [Nocardia gamkensis]|uniref:IrrE N-terminal-like domain-containing protein n=1 Tax=Nocardia gamkensis TaxID=352869 RepID=A0A7X6L5V3_9NOCA|nr:hypothetical protein [Nocardia gamkensis]NKY28317.1 hypothetical protein [Nocardia gamkensis]NQE71624.1 hypothetical protein [Nocardia gamkensis]